MTETAVAVNEVIRVACLGCQFAVPHGLCGDIQFNCSEAVGRTRYQTRPECFKIGLREGHKIALARGGGWNQQGVWRKEAEVLGTNGLRPRQLELHDSPPTTARMIPRQY